MTGLSAEVIEIIEKCLNHGNDVELKKVHGQIQVIEIQRKLKTKTPANG